MAEKKQGSSFLSWVYMIIPSTLDLSDTPLLSQKMGRKARGEKNFLLYDLKKFAGAGVLDGPEALRRRKLPRAGRIRPLRMTGNMVINPPGRLVVYGLATDVALPCVGADAYICPTRSARSTPSISPRTQMDRLAISCGQKDS